MSEATSDTTSGVFEAERAWQESQGRGYQKAQGQAAANAALVAAMVATTLYAPAAASPQMMLGIASVCATLLSRRGIDWRDAWLRAWTTANVRAA